MRGAACVFVNDVELKSNNGATAEPEVGDEEKIRFSIFGKEACVTIRTAKTGALQAFLTMNYHYQLEISGHAVPEDTTGDPPRSARESARTGECMPLSMRVSVRGFRVVRPRDEVRPFPLARVEAWQLGPCRSARALTRGRVRMILQVDWTGDMVTEYAILSRCEPPLPTPSAECAAPSSPYPSIFPPL